MTTSLYFLLLHLRVLPPQSGVLVLDDGHSAVVMTITMMVWLPALAAVMVVAHSPYTGMGMGKVHPM
jgi:hypothetical protein